MLPRNEGSPGCDGPIPERMLPRNEGSPGCDVANPERMLSWNEGSAGCDFAQSRADVAFEARGCQVGYSNTTSILNIVFIILKKKATMKYVFTRFVSKVLLTMHFERKMVNGKILIVYGPLIRTHGE